MSAGQKFRRTEWYVVRVKFVPPAIGESEQEDAVVALLRRSFREGPAAAADAHSAYKSWVHGVVELGATEAMPSAARRWSEFLDRCYDSNVGGFAEIDGVDFSQVPKGTPEQKPKQRMRMRM
jgi:hypothetical protein